MLEELVNRDPVTRPRGLLNLVTGQPLIKQIAQRHAGTGRRRLRDLLTDLSRSLIAASSSSAEPVNIICLPVTGSRPPKSRIWYLPPRCRMPVRSFGACFLRAMWGSLSSRIGQSVGQRSTKDQQFRGFAHFRGGGQGRGRTTDLPIFRSWDNSSPSAVNVHDLRDCIDLNTT